MRRLFRLFADSFREVIAFRVAVIVVGALSGGAASVWAVLSVWVLRVRNEMLVDAPEYAGDVSARDILPGALSLAGGVPWLPAAILILCMGLIVLLLRLPLPKPDNGFDRDPRRFFPPADRKWITGCADNRCEYRTLGLFRCRRRIQELDHWYPWSHGGATERRNLVGLCKHHNRRKTDHVPTLLGTWLLERARMRYFPPKWRGWCRPDGTAREPRDDEVEDVDAIESGPVEP